MEDLLKFLITKKASVIYKIKENSNINDIYKFILNQTSGQKNIISRILPDIICQEFIDKKFQRVSPNFGDYVIGDVFCNLYIPQSINHCVVYDKQQVDMELFDVVAEYDLSNHLTALYYNTELLTYESLPEKLIQRLVHRTKSTKERFMNEFLNLPHTNIEKILNYLAKGDVSLTFISKEGVKSDVLIMDYLKRMNSYVNVYPIDKNDNSKFVNKDFSILMDFYVTRILTNSEPYIGKIVIPMFQVKKYKKPIIRKDFIYVGYSDDFKKTVPNSDVIIELSEHNIPKRIISDVCTITLDACRLKIEEGDLKSFLNLYKTSYNCSLLNVI